MVVRNALSIVCVTCFIISSAGCGDTPAISPSDGSTATDLADETVDDVAADSLADVDDGGANDPAADESAPDTREDTAELDAASDRIEGDPDPGSCEPLAVVSESTWIDSESTAADTSGNRFSPPCAPGAAREQLVEIDLTAAVGNSDVVVFADCASLGIDCALYLFPGPVDACELTQTHVDHSDTICVNEAGLGTSDERLAAGDLAPGRYYLAVDGVDGTGGFFSLWIWIDAHDDALCRLRDATPLTGDSELPERNTNTGRDDFQTVCDGGNGSPEHIYTFEAEPGSVLIDAQCASVADQYGCVIGLAVSEGGCDLSPENVDDRLFGCIEPSSMGAIEGGCANVSGGTYLVLVDGEDGGAGQYSFGLTLGETITDEACALETRLVAPCDRRINPAPITGDIIIAGSTNGTSDPIMLPTVDNCAGGVAGAGDVFYQLEVAESTEVRFSLTCPEGIFPWDCALAVVEGQDGWDVCDLTQGAVDGAWACEDTFGGELRDLTVAPGDHFLVVTSEDADTEGEFTLDIDFAPFR